MCQSLKEEVLSGCSTSSLDITEMACTTPEEERTTIVIISGDADAMPAIHKVLKYRGWSVEVCMWEDAMSNELKKLPPKHPKVVVNYLDEFLERITFTEVQSQTPSFL